jgi:hypothetical protein
LKKSRFTEEQIAFALRQAETGTAVAEVIRKMGVNEQTFHRRKKQYAGMDVPACRCKSPPRSARLAQRPARAPETAAPAHLRS